MSMNEENSWNSNEIAIGIDDIKKWFLNGVQSGAKYMVIVCDTMDFCDFPKYAKDVQEANEIIVNFTSKTKSHSEGVYKIMEVYDLAADMETQLDEVRAWRLPIDENTPQKVIDAHEQVLKTAEMLKSIISLV